MVMIINPISIYNNYNFSFKGKDELPKYNFVSHSIADSSSASEGSPALLFGQTNFGNFQANLFIQQAIDIGTKMYKMTLQDLNNYDYAKGLDLELLPLEKKAISQDITAYFDYVINMDDKDINFSSCKIYLPKINEDNKLSKIAYINIFAHEYQHYLAAKAKKNRYANLYQNLKKENIFSMNAYDLFEYYADELISYLETDVRPKSERCMFGREGIKSFKQNAGMILTPKEINEDTVAQSIGYKNEKDLKECLKDFKTLDDITKIIIKDDPVINYKFNNNQEQTYKTVNKILREYIITHLLDEANSYYTEYKLSEKFCCTDYGVKYQYMYNKLIAEALKP